MGTFFNPAIMHVRQAPKLVMLFLYIQCHLDITVAETKPVICNKNVPNVSMEMKITDQTTKGFDLELYGFQKSLGNVTGQPLAQKMLATSLVAHLGYKDCAPLVLYMAGGTGTGKTRTAQILQNSWIDSSLNGSSAHYFHATNELSLNRYSFQEGFPTQLELNCPFPEGLHIFDNSDHYKHAVVWSIIETLRSSKHITEGSKCDCSSSVFIFIGNQGSNEILKAALHARSTGVWRNEIDERAVRNISSFISKPGYSILSELTRLNLIDHIIPFLPMEHQQVISCATAIARDLDMPEALIDIEAEKIADQLAYEAGYSIMGCARVRTLVKYRMTEIFLKENLFPAKEISKHLNYTEELYEHGNQREPKIIIKNRFYLVNNLNICISIPLSIFLSSIVYYLFPRMRE